MFFDSDSFLVGAGWGMTVPVGTPKAKDPTKEFVGAGPYWLEPKLLHTLPSAVDDIAATLGPKVYEAMLTDPAVRSSYGSLKLGILDGGVSLTSPVKMPAWSKRPGGKATKPKAGGQDGKADPGKAPAEAQQLTPDQSKAQEVLDFVQRGVDRLGESLLPQMFALLDAMAIGVKLAEVTCVVPADGPDAGKLVVGSVKVKPNGMWRFLVDQFANVAGILTWDLANGSWVVADPANFAWLSWMPKDSDPRGTSVLRSAYAAWNLKVQHWPMLYAHNVRFGSPGIDVEMAENDNEPRKPLDANGNELTDAADVSADERMKQAVALYRSGGTVIHPNGSKVNAFESQSDGSAIREAIALLDRQICMAIEYQAKATLEAEHSNKSQGQVGQDTKGLVNSYGKAAVCAVLRCVFRQNVRDNFGDDAAERFTPLFSLGDGDKQDKPAMISALGSVGFAVGQSQMEDIDAMLDLPVRDAQADAEAASQAMEQQASLAAKAKGPGTDTAGASSDKAKSEPKPGGPTK